MKTVCRRFLGLVSISAGFEGFAVAAAAGGGGGTENRARSWASVSRIKDVMSGFESRALVKILGGGKLWNHQLGAILILESSIVSYGRESIP